MKLYILRHEDRTDDATMFSPLTEDGLKNSIDLIDTIDDLNIDLIYSSPFIRTLQTIHPFAKKRNIKLNLEYSLSEIKHPHLIPKKSYSVALPVYLAKSFNYNPKYKSLIEPEDMNYPEDDKQVLNRSRKFLNKIMNENCTTKKNILFVTHQIVCNSLLKIATKQESDVEISSTDKYPKGCITRIWDTDSWDYERINH